MKLTYNWHYEFDRTNLNDVEKIFSVRDFTGDACKSIASRIRGCVSKITFENFHHNSSIKIREAVFGFDQNGDIKEKLLFKNNLLCISSVDIQNVEVTDEKTRENLTR